MGDEIRTLKDTSMRVSKNPEFSDYYIYKDESCVVTSGEIAHNDGLQIKYKIELNGVKIYPDTDYTPLANSPITTNRATIKHGDMVDGKNVFSIVVEDSNNTQGMQDYVLYKEPINTPSMKRSGEFIDGYEFDSLTISSVEGGLTFSVQGENVVITTKHDINTKYRTGIKKVNVIDNSDIDIPINKQMLYAVSFDNKTTWKTYKNSVWENVDIKADFKTKGMTKLEVESITEEQWSEVFAEDVKMHFAILFENKTFDTQASFDSLEVVYSDNKTPQIVGSVDSNTIDYNPINLSGTISKEKQKLKYRILVNGEVVQGWSGYLLSPQNVKYDIALDKFNEGVNTITLEVADEFGDISTYRETATLNPRDATIKIIKPTGTVPKNNIYMFPFEIKAPFFGKNTVTKDLEYVKTELEGGYVFEVEIDRTKANNNQIDNIQTTWI